MSVRRFMAALAVLAVAIGVTASAVLAAQGSAQKTTVKVTALDSLKFTLSTKTAPAGAVTFVVTNKGNATHDFSIAGKKTKQLKKGQSATLTVNLKKGNNAYKCTVPGHAAAGMKGTFKAT